MKSILIFASVVTLAVAGPYRGLVDPGAAGPAPAPEYEPVDIGPVPAPDPDKPVVIPEPVLPPHVIRPPSEDVIVSPAVPIANPVVQIILNINNQQGLVPGIVVPKPPVDIVGSAPKPVVIPEPVLPPHVIRPPSEDVIVSPAVPIANPVVQIILNINNQQGLVPGIVVPKPPVDIVGSAPEPVEIGIPVVPPYPAEVLPEPVETVPEPVQIGVPVLPYPAEILPENLN